MYYEEQEEMKFNDFIQTSILMEEAVFWLKEYAVFGDGLDSDLEYQDNPKQ